MSADEIVSVEEAKTLKDRPEVLFVDLREPNELEELGFIPGTTNISVKIIEDVLKNMTPEEFKSKFNKDKPGLDTEIVFHCMAGGRSTRACNAAKALGYTNVRNFKGGWKEWAANQ